MEESGGTTGSEMEGVVVAWVVDSSTRSRQACDSVEAFPVGADVEEEAVEGEPPGESSRARAARTGATAASEGVFSRGCDIESSRELALASEEGSGGWPHIMKCEMSHGLLAAGV